MISKKVTYFIFECIYSPPKWSNEHREIQFNPLGSPPIDDIRTRPLS